MVKDGYLFEDFVPFLFEQYKSETYLEYDRFDKGVDIYFSNIETQKIESQHEAKEQEYHKKINKVKDHHKKKVEDLQHTLETNQSKAELIELNLDAVDQAIKIIGSAIASSMNWDELKEIVKKEKKKGDPIANIIHQLKLETNQISLLLTNPIIAEDDENFGDKKPQIIDVDISLSAYANAAKYHDL